MDPIQRARELLARTEGLTPGPWDYEHHDDAGDWIASDPAGLLVEVVGSPDYRTDARAIAALPEFREVLAEIVAAYAGEE